MDKMLIFETKLEGRGVSINERLKNLVDAVRFPVENYRDSVRTPNQNETYVDTKVPEEMYQALKRNILANYIEAYAEEVQVNQANSKIDLANVNILHNDYNVYDLLCMGHDFGIFKSGCKYMLRKNEEFEVFVELFIHDSTKYWKFYNELKETGEFLKLFEAVCQIFKK